MIYLDTHLVVWLYAGLTEKLSKTARNLINEHELLISPLCRLELQYLWEIERVTQEPDEIISDLNKRIGLEICSKSFDLVVSRALKIDWTRDPFDRLIVSQAAVDDTILLTKDKNILANYFQARW